MPRVRTNGIDIEYESFGRDGDPLILLIMGFGARRDSRVPARSDKFAHRPASPSGL